MNISKVKQLGALRPEAARRAMSNIHMAAPELTHFKGLAKTYGVNFSTFVRAALRTLEKDLKNGVQQ
jgi:hypothetical protein